jgi:hypothetical protein
MVHFSQALIISFFLTACCFQVHIDFDDEQDKITVEGPPEEVEVIVQKINEQKTDLVRRDSRFCVAISEGQRICSIISH